MKRTNTQSIREVIRQYLKEMQLDRKLQEVALVNEWENLVGKIIASKTERIYIHHEVLYVHIRSSVVKHELIMISEELKEALNKKAGEVLVKEIIFK
ncbi:MAG: DUF721 domain-containing protein [Bacteroidales bacterium]|nr:DUF721 domain-containing protein [Bacteroidales bacterium]